MRYIKKMTALVLVLCMCAGMSACGRSAAKELDVDKPTTVTIWYQDESYTEYLDYVAKQFTSENELVSITYQLVTSDNYVEYIYDESVHNGNAPDIFLMSTDSLEKASLMGLVAENTSYSSYYSEKNYGSAAVNAASYDGKLYGYPVSFNVPFLLYNADVASEVSTFGQLEEYVNTYTVDENNQNITQLVTWDASDMFTNYGFSGNAINLGGSSGDDSSNLSVDKNTLVNNMTKFVNLRDIFGIDRNSASLDDVAAQFVEGKVAYTITDAKHLKTIVDSGVNYAVCKVPDLDENTATGSMSENICAFVNPYAGHVQAAKAVAHAISYDYADKMYDTAGVLSARIIKNKDKAYSTRVGKIYEIYGGSSVKAKFMGGMYFYTKYEILIHQVWDGDDINTSVESFVGEIKTGI